MQCYCTQCGRTMDEGEFYTSNNLEKYPNGGKLNTCKKCTTLMVDNWDPDTFIPILKEIDIPYIEDEWNTLLERYGKNPEKLTGLSIIGRYISKMKLKQFKTKRWADTEALAAEAAEKKRKALEAAGFNEQRIEEELAADHRPEKPAATEPESAEAMPDAQGAGGAALDFVSSFDSEPDEFEDKLTDEDKTYLKLKWGRGYRWDEMVRLEQMYNDMMASYDIQTAGHKDYLIMICKTSLKANQLIDINDIDGFQKVSKVYDQLMKSSKFTAAQNKEDTGEAVDSVGEIVAICETDGFIPRYYTDGPQDKVDRVLEDMQQYTHDLVTEELGLGNLIENAFQALQKEQQAIEDAGGDAASKKEEDELFKYDKPPIEDSDYDEFHLMEDQMLEQDQQTWANQRFGG